MENYRHGLFGTRRLIITAILALMLSGTSACHPPNESRNAVPQRDINTVMEVHVNGLMAIPGVTGVAIGEMEDKTPCILVLVVEETDEINRRVPEVLEGHPVRILESGEIRPMRGD